MTDYCCTEAPQDVLGVTVWSDGAHVQVRYGSNAVGTIYLSRESVDALVEQLRPGAAAALHQLAGFREVDAVLDEHGLMQGQTTRAGAILALYERCNDALFDRDAMTGEKNRADLAEAMLAELRESRDAAVERANEANAAAGRYSQLIAAVDDALGEIREGQSREQRIAELRADLAAIDDALPMVGADGKTRAAIIRALRDNVLGEAELRARAEAAEKERDQYQGARDAHAARCTKLAREGDRYKNAVNYLRRRAAEPVPLVLFCPACGERHVDAGEWATREHRTHECEACGFRWAPAAVPTVGVLRLPAEPAVEPDFGDEVES